jgi:serine protease Do
MRRFINTMLAAGVVAVAAAVGLFFSGAAQAATTGVDTIMVPANFSQLAETAKSGVVNIRTVKTVNGGGPVFRHFFRGPFGNQDPFRDFFGGGPMREFKQRSLGSGFIISKDGFIVTNNHVIEDADQIKVRLFDDEEFDAEVVGRDPKTDLALIKISATHDFEPLKLGNSDTLPVGSWVIAIGSPFGLEQTVTAGIVSAKGRIIGSGPYDDFIQTDASINPGNSGGPLLGLNGEVVGINTAIVASGQGIGFAIPINLAAGIIDQLRNTGEVSRGWLGVGIQNLTPELAEYYGIDREDGVMVTQVYNGDPADKAGIKPGDVIISLDGNPVTDSRDLSKGIADTGAGNRAKVTFLRGGEEKTVRIKLGKRSESEPGAVRTSSSPSSDLGLEVRELDSELAERMGIEDDTKGVVVTGIEPDGKASEAGIQRGDIIVEINRQSVASISEYKSIIDGLKEGDSVQILLRRGGGALVVAKFTR